MSEGMRQDIQDLKTGLGEVRVRLDGVETRLDRVETRLDRVETTTRNIAIKVAEHDERFTRIDEKLKKLDILDDIKRTLDGLASEVLSSRRDRVLFDKTFADQQKTLTDHELRLTRLELERKPS